LIAELEWTATADRELAGARGHHRQFRHEFDLPIVMLWGESDVMIYNDAYAVFAGRRHPGLLGRNVLDGWPEIAAFSRRVLDVVLGQGGKLSFRDQHLILNRNGDADDVFADLDYSPVLDAEGKPAGVFGLVRETTEYVRTQERLRIAQEAGHVGSFEWYPDSGLLDVSDEYRRIWGLDQHVIVTADLLVSLLHPDDRPVAGPSRPHRQTRSNIPNTGVSIP
jgi:PAS domain-containing protein